MKIYLETLMKDLSKPNVNVKVKICKVVKRKFNKK